MGAERDLKPRIVYFQVCPKKSFDSYGKQQMDVKTFLREAVKVTFDNSSINVQDMTVLCIIILNSEEQKVGLM
jgi:hypothetical protein